MPCAGSTPEICPEFVLPASSRSYCAKLKIMFRFNLPIEVAVLKCSVMLTSEIGMAIKDSTSLTKSVRIGVSRSIL